MCPASPQSTTASSQQPPLPSTSTSFPPPTIIPPQSEHTHTAVLLHGRGSTGEEFAEEFFTSTPSQGHGHGHDQKTLREMLPGWRWVFPSSRELWSTAFQEYMPAWFDGYSLTDPATRQELQVDGLVESIRQIEGILDEELGYVDNQAGRLVLGGISQGGTVALWILLRQRRQLFTSTSISSAAAAAAAVNTPTPASRFGGFVGASTWLPFAKELRQILRGSDNHSPSDSHTADGKVSEFMSFVKDNTATATATTTGTVVIKKEEDNNNNNTTDVNPGPEELPVLMGHGVDDAYVNVDLGREAKQLLAMAGFNNVQWKEYSGAELEGHWLKVPEQMDDIYKFLADFTTTRK